jgi:hypothetical protein
VQLEWGFGIIMDEKFEMAGSPYPFARSSLVFAWLCSKCYWLNYINYDNWSAYNNIDECEQCEKAHTVKEPWK